MRRLKLKIRKRERCLVCGHYHGGQGGCIVAHAFVPAEDCPTCMAEPHKAPPLRA